MVEYYGGKYVVVHETITNLLLVVRGCMVFLLPYNLFVHIQQWACMGADQWCRCRCFRELLLVQCRNGGWRLILWLDGVGVVSRVVGACCDPVPVGWSLQKMHVWVDHGCGRLAFVSVLGVPLCVLLCRFAKHICSTTNLAHRNTMMLDGVYKTCC